MQPAKSHHTLPKRVRHLSRFLRLAHQDGEFVIYDRTDLDRLSPDRDQAITDATDLVRATHWDSEAHFTCEEIRQAAVHAVTFIHDRDNSPNRKIRTEHAEVYQLRHFFSRAWRKGDLQLKSHTVFEAPDQPEEIQFPDGSSQILFDEFRSDAADLIERLNSSDPSRRRPYSAMISIAARKAFDDILKGGGRKLSRTPDEPDDHDYI